MRLTLEYDYMCSETDFTQANKRIEPCGKFGLSLVLLTACCCSVTKRTNSGIAEALRAPYGQPDRKISVFYAFPYHKFRPVVALLYTHNYGLKKDNLKCEHVMI